jgi:hypothetical protein
LPTLEEWRRREVKWNQWIGNSSLELPGSWP